MICKIVSVLIVCFSISTGFTQNVGINGNGSTPNPKALLDIDATSMNPKGGLLIPRLTTIERNAISPPIPESLLIFNTTTKCFEAYVNNAWNSVSCPSACNPPVSPGLINGIICAVVGQTGISYSIAPVAGATSYTWTVPSGAILTSGQGSNAITVTLGSISGNITVIANNSCGSSAPSILPVTAVYRNCLEILTANPSSGDGVYTIDPDGTGNLPCMQCYCDMTTDGGGWTLVLNYQHLGGTNPTLNIRTNSLPLLGTTILGIDESGTSFWGHASSNLMNAINFSSIRFFAKTSAHTRNIHFKTSNLSTISYFKTGIGSCSGIQSGFTILAGHTSFLPLSSNLFFSNQASLSLSEFPFYLGNTYHWGVRGAGTRWEVDDFPSNAANSTFHQIWVK